MLCRQCSEGLPHDEHDMELNTWQPTRTLGIAIKGMTDLTPLFQQWEADTSGRLITLTIPTESGDDSFN